MAREAILRIFALTPDYEDCWSLFERMYHSEDIWRRADQALARHRESLVALEQRAQIAVALEEPLRAESLTAVILERRGPYVPAYLLRAEAVFDGGRDSPGRYRVTLAATDLPSNVKSKTVALDITVH